MRVAIIGAGMAGLTCASQLTEAGHEVTVFDKGRGPGGRMATRRVEHGGETYRFDHGAQYFTAREMAFQTQVRAWEADGIVAPWPAAKQGAWVGTPAMNAPIRAMADALGARFGTRIHALERIGETWRLAGADIAESFDAVVVAVPAEQVAPLLAVHTPHIAEAAQAIDSNPCWTAMIAFDGRVDAPDTLRDEGAIGWAARNSSKPGREADQECWVIQADARWSRAQLERKADDVGTELLAHFARAVGDLPPVLFSTAHRWRYAMCEKNDAGALWDADQRIGACGDWLSGPRVENAFLSGIALARRIEG
ncbi:MAG: FAD-dependent oxidoreductase [Erythrobacter sp.]|nr:FAD-dependent oxidoreductase [Erythrobacter sp.]NCQ62320.1 FAD-dependent oxidoreductase [Alphaproteobacteria bacterium]